MTRIVDYYRAKGILPTKEENKRASVSKRKSPINPKPVKTVTPTHEASTANFDTPLFPPIHESAFASEVAAPKYATKENEVESNKEESKVQELEDDNNEEMGDVGRDWVSPSPSPSTSLQRSKSTCKPVSYTHLTLPTIYSV